MYAEAQKNIRMLRPDYETTNQGIEPDTEWSRIFFAEYLNVTDWDSTNGLMHLKNRAKEHRRD